MIARQTPKTQVLVESSVDRKLAHLSRTLEELLAGGNTAIPQTPGRDVQILPIRELPPKRGLSFRDGQARLLHDLASIELQAMELGVRTLAEFPDAPEEFRRELANITQEEGEHLQLCLKAMEDLGIPWGSFPTHVGLWESVAETDSLLDRIVIVHRYLEGSGLDASDTLLRRLSGVDAEAASRAVRVIRQDEMGHVQFGSRWYHRLVREQGLNADEDFLSRLTRLFHRIPRRLEPIVTETRLEAGFTEQEIQALNQIRGRWIEGSGPKIHQRSQT
jgi:uncharacterized ferritin-like protein (DUF455 family)